MKEQADSKRQLFPDLEVCRTRLLEPVGLVECLVGSPEKCPYALAFGGDYFCQHPDCLTFTRPRPTNA
jgi:hypothetical protein